jgi:DNA polymerase IV
LLADGHACCKHDSRQIRQELNLTASAGVAPNKFLVKLASDWRKLDGLFVIQPEEVDTFLLPPPVGRLPEVGKVTGGEA